ncbi:MAG: hypothetical protein ACK526_13985 [Planctomyces sp.]
MTESTCGIRRRDPTPEQIAEQRLAIQATWTPDERFKRMRCDWRPSFRLADGRRQTMAEEVYEEHHSERERQ